MYVFKKRPLWQILLWKGLRTLWGLFIIMEISIRRLFGLIHPVVVIVVHRYHPHIGGCEFRTRFIAHSLIKKGYYPVILTPREWAQPLQVDGIPVIQERRILTICDVMFTYSSTRYSIETSRWIYNQKIKPVWIHYPCAVARKGLDLIKKADRIIAFNKVDIELTKRICGTDSKAIYIPPSSHESRLGKPGEFRKKSGITCKYILWAGAWSEAKGVVNLVTRFHKLRRRHPNIELKLVMFGAYDNREYPPSDPDIVRYDQNSEDLPSAISDCLFIAFNSPAHPIGYDANPLILLEALINGKTFVAQWGTPLLQDIMQLGICVNSDTDWIEAAEKLLLDDRYRLTLEHKCRQAYLKTYNFHRTIHSIESVLEELLSKNDR